MSWRYGCKKFDMGNGEHEYGLVEVYKLEGEYNLHTQDPVHVYAETPEELAKWLMQAAEDILKYGAVGDDN